MAAKKKATKAKAKPKATEVEETTTISTNERRLEREPSAMHHRLAAYIEEQTGYEPDIKTVQLVSNMRNEWRKTDDYVEFKAEQEAEREEEEAPKPRRKAAPKKAASKSRAKSTAKKKAAPKRKPKAAEEDDPFDD